MYRALYRKWRPQKFSDVIGQKPIVTALTNQIEAGRVGHAYLFTGSRGTGKTTCAKIFAKAVNCETPVDNEPCGNCTCCQGIDDGSVLDVAEIDAASNNSVDDIRDLRDETAYRPSHCQYKVYIIDEVHMLSTAAFNALLKILEEPPTHVIFILATTEIHKVPATVLSRCQRFDFARIDSTLITERLQHIASQEDFTIEQPAAELIARLADGSMRDALSLLDTCAGTSNQIDEALVRSLAGVTDRNYLFTISDATTEQNVPVLLQEISSLHRQSIDIKRLTEELIFHYRNFLLALSQPDGSLLGALSGSEKERYLAAAKTMHQSDAIAAVRRLATALDSMGKSTDPRIELELALFELAGYTGAATPQPAETAAVKTQTAPRTEPQKTAATKPAPSSVATAKDTAEQTVENTVEDTPSAVKAEKVATEQLAKKAEETATPTQPTADKADKTAAPEKEADTAATPQSTATDGIAMLFDDWPKVLQRMAEEDKMLYGFMENTQAYYDGRYMLIDGGDVFLTYMRESEDAAQTIKRIIHEVSGISCAIGPYNKEKQQKKIKSAHDTLGELEARGAPIEYI